MWDCNQAHRHFTSCAGSETSYSLEQAYNARAFAQGDEERAHNMSISPLCEPTLYVAKSQLGFIDFVTRPVLNTFHDFYSPKSSGGTTQGAVTQDDTIFMAMRLLVQNYDHSS